MGLGLRKRLRRDGYYTDENGHVWQEVGWALRRYRVKHALRRAWRKIRRKPAHGLPYEGWGGDD